MRNNLSKWLVSALLSITATASALAAPAPGVEPPRRRPMIEVGAGGIVPGLGSYGMNVLLRVGFSIRQTEPSEPGDILGPEQLVWAQLNADIALGENNGSWAPPYFDIRFVPVSNQISIVSEAGNAMMGNLQALPMSVNRNMAMDRALTINVSVVGVQFGIARSISPEKAALFAQVAVDAVGYKAAFHASDLGTYHGFHLAALAAEGGLAFTPNQQFTIRVALGGSADVNFGGNVGGGFAVQSDMSAYLAIKADIARLMNLFDLSLWVRGGVNAGCNSGGGYGCQAAPFVMFGATFIF